MFFSRKRNPPKGGITHVGLYRCLLLRVRYDLTVVDEQQNIYTVINKERVFYFRNSWIYANCEVYGSRLRIRRVLRK